VSHTNATPLPATEIIPTPVRVIERIQLSDGYSVTPDFFEEIRLHIEGRLPELLHGRPYTAKQLAGKEFWQLLDSGDQRMAGRCIARMAARHLLPLTFVKGKHEFPLRYQLQ
jgi:hypothetical protein